MKIILGFDDSEIISRIKTALESRNVDVNFCICTTKLEIYQHVFNDLDVKGIVLTEYIDKDGKWSAYELAKFNDYRNINIIPILQENKKGTEFLKIIYAANITSAILGDASPELISDLLLNRRTRKDAKKYYGFFETPVVNYEEVTGEYLEFLLSKLESADKKDTAAVFDDACAQLSKKQIENFLTKVSGELMPYIKKSNTYAALNNTKKAKDKTENVIKQKYTGCNIPVFNMLYGFDSESIIKKIENKIVADNCIIGSSLIRYNKEGIKNAISATPVNSVIVTENLEKRGPYTAEELVELKRIKNVKIIPLLRSSEKVSSAYINKLYSEGITEAIIGPVSYEDIAFLTENNRTRRYAREYYGLDMEAMYVPKLCNKYIGYINSYLKYGQAELEDKFKFVKRLLSEEQQKDLEKNLSEEVYEKLIEDNLIGKRKRKNKRKENKNRSIGKKTEKDNSNEEVLENAILLDKKKKIIGGGIGVLVLLLLCVILTHLANGSRNDKQYDTTQIVGSVARNVETIVYETTTVETTIAETTEEITTTEQTTEETTIKNVKKKKRKKKKKSVKKAVKETTPETVTKKTTNNSSKKKKVTETKKVIKNVGSHSESNSISGGKVSILRNSAVSGASGSLNGELSNLAKYMSAAGITNASSAYSSLTNQKENLKSKTCILKIESDSNENILQAAEKVSNKIGGISCSKYGVGVSSFKAGSGYKVFVVVVYK